MRHHAITSLENTTNFKKLRYIRQCSVAPHRIRPVRVCAHELQRLLPLHVLAPHLRPRQEEALQRREAVDQQRRPGRRATVTVSLQRTKSSAQHQHQIVVTVVIVGVYWSAPLVVYA